MRKSKFLEMGAALLCALCLWIYVVTVVTPEDDITITNIPVTFVGEAELRSEYGLIIANRSADMVSVKFHGPRADLKKLNSDRAGIVVTIDVSQLRSEKEYTSSYEIALPSALQDGSITVTDRMPRTIKFSVEKLASRTVEVKGIFTGTVAEGCVAGDLTFDQDTITVQGPEDIVKQVDYAQVMLDGTGISQTITKRLSFDLIDQSGMPLEAEDLVTGTQEIEVTLPVLHTKEIPLTITVVPGGGANENNTTIAVVPEKITVSGEGGVLDAMTEVNLGEIDLAQAEHSSVMNFDITLPEGVENLSDAKQAVVTVTMSDLQTEPFRVTDIRAENVADGLSAEIMTQMLNVTIRGDRETLDALDETTFTAVADMTDYREAGSFTVPVTIFCGDGATCGATGEYTVVIDLQPTAAE